MSNQSDNDHLSDVADGAGCTEIWETLSERREQRAQTTGRQVDAEGNPK